MNSDLAPLKKIIVASIFILGLLLIMVALYSTNVIGSQETNKINTKEVSVTENEIKQSAYSIAVGEFKDRVGNPGDYFGNPELYVPNECSVYDECSIEKIDINKFQINAKMPKVFELMEPGGDVITTSVRGVDYQVVLEYRGYGDINSRGNWFMEEIIIDKKNILDPSKSIPIGETFRIDTSKGGEDEQLEDTIFLHQSPADNTVDAIQGVVAHNMEVTLREYNASDNSCLVEVDYKYSGWLQCANLHGLPTFMTTKSAN